MSSSARAGGHVFISYVREDSAEVDRLQQVLEGAGLQTWRDTAQLWPGQDWRGEIRRAIADEALVFLACFSRSSGNRAASYQNEELTQAIEQLRLRPADSSWLIPVRFDDCKIPDRDLGSGRTLASIQRADLFGDSYDQKAGRLAEAIRRVLKVPGPWPVIAASCEDDPGPAGGDVHIRHPMSPALPSRRTGWNVPARNLAFTGRGGVAGRHP